MNSSPLPPGFITKLLHIREPRQHVSECDWFPSSAGLLAKKYNRYGGYNGKTSPPLHFRLFVVKGSLAHNLIKCTFNGVFTRVNDLLPVNPAMSRVIH